MQKWNRRAHLITRRGLLYSLALCVLILAFGGIGFWILEPRAETLTDGLWLAFTTAATVGYGDIIPSTHASRAFAVVVVLLGLAVLSLVTVSVAAMLVEPEERQIERAQNNPKPIQRACVAGMFKRRPAGAAVST